MQGKFFITIDLGFIICIDNGRLRANYEARHERWWYSV